MVYLFTTVAGLSRYLFLSQSQQQPFHSPLAEAGDKTSSKAEDDDHKATDVARQTSDRNACFNIGLVPTMGALHEGHLSLIHRARQENELVVVSIFVNPLQFGPSEDLHEYPRTLERDRHLCEEAGVDAIFAPSIRELYQTSGAVPDAEDVTQVIPPVSMTAVLCGRSRLGHFEGVATVVTRLLNLIQPKRAYFGQKDAQQVAILKRLVQDLNLSVELICCPIIRESNGLALSSRNQYLTPEQKEQAAVLYRSLKQAAELFHGGEQDSAVLMDTVTAEIETVPTVELEYVELVHPTTLVPIDEVEVTGLLAIAAHLGSTRLIDNIVLNRRRPIIAIDGPAGAGKSTVARQVSQILNLLYLDTGAMYRAVTWLVLQSGVALADEAAIAELTSQCRIRLLPSPPSSDESPASSPDSSLADGTSTRPKAPKPVQVWVNNQDVTQAIRTPEVTANVSAIAAQVAVREALVRQQQAQGRKGGIVLDGRDIGTHVFPDAELKIFLTATPEERARRRLKDLEQQGYQNVDIKELEASIRHRDYQDSTRSIAPLRKAIDAIEVQTDSLSIEDVIARIVELYHQIATG